jgi:threonylcarbamoyladenosine tRNA methylthiotransferase MtaB
MNKTVAIHTLGCKLNFAESSTIGRQLKGGGFQLVDFEEKADIYVINTCSVTENADKKCRKIVKQALKRNAEAFVIVIGCYAQLKPQEIAQIPGVDLTLGAAEKFNILSIIKDYNKKQFTEIHSCNIKEVKEFVPSYSTEDRTRAFLKIQDGCDYKCSFCTIPLARGASRSAPLSVVLENARTLEEKGFQELVLTGINLGDYGSGLSSEVQLLDALKALNQELSSIQRIRLSSIEPNLLTDEIIAFIAEHPKFMPHFHIPLQSGSNTILSLMRRRYKKELYENRVLTIKKLIPNASIGCDVIVGFPGEKHVDFLETYEFLLDIPVTYLHVFPFSERSDTHAVILSDKVEASVKEERAAQLRNLSIKKKYAFSQSFVGSVCNVLFENVVEEGRIWGFTENYIRVGVASRKELVNRILPVVLEEVDKDGLVKGSEVERIEQLAINAEESKKAIISKS